MMTNATMTNATMTNATAGASRFYCLLVTIVGLGMVSACGDNAEVVQQAVESVSTERVIITLKSSDIALGDVISELKGKYPAARVVRVFPNFNQLVLELPSSDRKRLNLDPGVLQVAEDNTNEAFTPDALADDEGH